MSVQAAKVDVKKISEVSLFVLSFGGDEGPLKQSLSEHGLLSSVTLLDDGVNLKVIDGQQRVQVARGLRWPEINATIYEKRELSHRQAFLLAIEINRWSRAFNLIEQGFILKQAQEVLDQKTIEQKIYPFLSIRHPNQEKELLSLLALEPDIQQYVISRELPASVIGRFNLFSKEDRVKLFKELSVLSLNQNKLSEILDLLYEISKRDSQKPADLLCETLKFCGDADNTNQVVENLRRLLREKRNPRLISKKQKFEGQLMKIGLPKSVAVHPSAYFEENFVDLKARLSSKSDCEELIKCLERDEWKDLL